MITRTFAALSGKPAIPPPMSYLSVTSEPNIKSKSLASDQSADIAGAQQDAAKALHVRGVDDILGIGKLIESAEVNIDSSDAKTVDAWGTSDASDALGMHVVHGSSRSSAKGKSIAQLDPAFLTSIPPVKKGGRPRKGEEYTEDQRRAGKKASRDRSREINKLRLKSDKPEDIAWAAAHREQRKEWEKFYQSEVCACTN